MALFKYFSWVSKLPSAEDTNIGVEATKSMNAEVQCVMEDAVNEVVQHQGRKCKVCTTFTPELRASIGTVTVKYWHT